MAAMIREQAKVAPASPALIVPSGKDHLTLTYQEFWSNIQSYAAFLQSLGLAKGDRMIILSENCAEWLYAHYAGMSLGVITVPIYPTLPLDQAQYIAKDAAAKVALCGSDEQKAKLEGIPGIQIEKLREERHGVLNEADWNHLIDSIDPTDLAIFIYTSGTTGQPKGAMLTHQAFLTVCEHITPYLGITTQDVFFSFLPLSHIFEQIA